MVVEIPLTQGLVALVDDADAPAVLAQGKWCAFRYGQKRYAMRTDRPGDGTRRTVYLHVLLTGWDLTDHHNGNGLDCRRVNMREATLSENARNRRKQRNNTSGYTGVTKDGNRWRAQVRVDGRLRSVGSYATPEDAAHAYDAAARELHGQFATVNFPMPGERAS